MPVVAMHQLGTPRAVQTIRKVRSAPTQCSKTPVVVGIGVVLPVVVGVARPVIQAGSHQHIGLQRAAAWAQAGKLTRNDVHFLTPGCREAADFVRRTQTGRYSGESGQQNAYRATVGTQRCGQSPGHIGKPTRFEQGKEFGADLENAHVQDPGWGD